MGRKTRREGREEERERGERGDTSIGRLRWAKKEEETKRKAGSNLHGMAFLTTRSANITLAAFLSERRGKRKGPLLRCNDREKRESFFARSISKKGRRTHPH